MRHAKAKPRSSWSKAEGDRPLAVTGLRQAQAVGRLLQAWNVTSIGTACLPALAAGTAGVVCAAIGAVWRSRWDSLVLFTPAQYDDLPGMSFPATRDTYPGKDDVADYLRAYAAEFELPLQFENFRD